MLKDKKYPRRKQLALMAGGTAATVLRAEPAPQAGEGAKPLSAASKRALAYTKGPEWFCYFKKENVAGDLGYEVGVHRRDPSAVIKVGDLYYVWYTKSVGESAGFGTGDPAKMVFPWDLSEV